MSPCVTEILRKPVKPVLITDRQTAWAVYRYYRDSAGTVSYTHLMMTLYPKVILDALATVRYPGTGKNVGEAEMVADNLRIDGMSVSFSLIFEKPTDPFMKSMITVSYTHLDVYKRQ